MSRTRRFINGVMAGYLQYAVVTVCGLWLTRFLLRWVGTEEYGLWLVVLQLLAFLELMDLGVVALLPREVAYVTGRNADPEARAAALSAFLGQVTRLVLWQMPLVAVAAAGFWAVAGGGEGMALPLGVVALAYVLTFPLRIFLPVLQGLQDLVFLGLANTVAWLVQAAVMLGLVLAGWGFWSLVVGWGAGRCAAALLGWHRLHTRFPGTLPRSLAALAPGAGWRMLGRGLWVSVGKVAQVLLNGSEIIILGRLLGPAAVVAYACTAKLITVFGNQTYLLVLTAEPALSELKASASSQRVAGASTALSQLMLLASGMLACLVVATNEGFVGWWVGPDYYGGAALTALLLAAMVTRHLAFTVSHTLFCFGHERSLAVSGLADGAFTVGGTWLLVRLLGPLGVPLGSLAGVLLVGLPVNLYLLAKATDASPLSLLWSHLPWLWRFLALIAVLGATGQVWRPQGFLALAATAVGVLGLYALVMFPMVRRSLLWPFFQPQVASLRTKLGMLRT